MSLIEGVGDEVTDFFIVVVVLLVSWLAWCSTRTTRQSLRRTVLILQHLSLLNGPPNLEVSEEETVEQTSEHNSDTRSSCPEPSVAETSGAVPPEANTTSEATATEEVLIEAMDSFNSDNAPSLRKQTKINTSDASNIPTPACADAAEYVAENLSTSGTNDISVKLKFINDDQKVVTGGLNELLGDFKRRHFQIELEAQKLVRLVFNGRILQPDSLTLERCGLYNNCVVHCLVHQPRPNPTPTQASTLDNSSSIYFNPQSFSDVPPGSGIGLIHNEWDLSRLLVSILTLMLGLAWYSRYHYAQLFTATTTLALYALTAIFTVSLFSNFFPDQDNIRNIE